MSADRRQRDPWLALVGTKQAEGIIPPPPYQLTDADFLMVGVAFDEKAIARLLPHGLTPLPGASGAFYVYSAAVGWGITPFTAAFAWVDVEGHDAIDGLPGRAVLCGFYSGKAHKGLTEHWDVRLLEGGSLIERKGDACTGTGYRGEQEVFRLGLRPDRSQPLTTSVGVHHYWGEDRHGQPTLITGAFSREHFRAEPLSVELLVSPSDPLAVLKPVRLLWAAEVPKSTLTLGVPALLSESERLAGETARTAFLQFLSEFDRGAVIVGRSGRVMFLNPLAERLVGNGIAISGGRLRPSSPADGPALDRLIERALGAAGPAIEPIALRRPDGSSPLLVQAISGGFANRRETSGRGESTAVLLVTDPVLGTERDPAVGLRLLGLAPAEARVAALVGSGLSVREAAQRLGNSAGTVRITLSRVYAKLDISRQSELAKLVSRVESIGV